VPITIAGHGACCLPLFDVNRGSANFLGSRARSAPKELAAGRTSKFYVKIVISVD